MCQVGIQPQGLRRAALLRFLTINDQHPVKQTEQVLAQSPFFLMILVDPVLLRIFCDSNIKLNLILNSIPESGAHFVVSLFNS